MKINNKYLSSTFKKTDLNLLFLFCFAVFPVSILGLLILKYGVDVPFMDQWDTPGMLFQLIHDGQTLTGDHFLSQHNESRLVFPRVIFLILAYLTHWNIKFEILLVFLSACLISLGIYRLKRLTLTTTKAESFWLIFASNLLIFSPIQQENWLWGIQLVVFIPILCVVATLYTLLSSWKTWIKLFSVVSLCTISTFSFSNGFIAWIAILIFILLSNRWSGKGQKRSFIFLYLLSFLANVILYFYNYQKPGQTPSPTEVFIHPIKAGIYLFTFLGSPLSGGNIIIAGIVGATLLVIFLGTCLYFSVQFFKKDKRLDDSFITWFTIGNYALISALVATLGRSGFGIEQAMASRYTTTSTYLIIAIIFLVTIVVQDIKYSSLEKYEAEKFNENFVANPINTAIVLPIVLSSIISFHIFSFVYGVQAMQATWRDRLYAKTCLTYIDYVSNDCTTSLYPVPETPQKRSHIFNDMGFINPPLATTGEIQRASGNKKFRPKNYGVFGMLTPIGNGYYTASGWAVFPGKNSPADAVLLTYRDAENKAIVFAVAPVKTPRLDVAQVLGSNGYLNSGWTTNFSSEKLPPGELKIQAWAYNTETGKSYRIGGGHTLKR